MGCTHMSTEVEEAMQSLAHQIEDAYCPLCGVRLVERALIRLKPAT